MNKKKLIILFFYFFNNNYLNNEIEIQILEGKTLNNVGYLLLAVSSLLPTMTYYFYSKKIKTLNEYQKNSNKKTILKLIRKQIEEEPNNLLTVLPITLKKKLLHQEDVKNKYNQLKTQFENDHIPLPEYNEDNTTAISNYFKTQIADGPDKNIIGYLVIIAILKSLDGTEYNIFEIFLINQTIIKEYIKDIIFICNDEGENNIPENNIFTEIGRLGIDYNLMNKTALFKRIKHLRSRLLFTPVAFLKYKEMNFLEKLFSIISPTIIIFIIYSYFYNDGYINIKHYIINIIILWIILLIENNYINIPITSSYLLYICYQIFKKTLLLK